MNKMMEETKEEGKLKKEIGCPCGKGANFKFTEINDNYGDVIKLKICRECGAIWDRDFL